MVYDLGSNFFPKYHYRESFEIFMWELNKMHDIGVQFVGDKKNKGMIQNKLKSFTKCSLVHSCTLSTFPLYN